MPEPIRLALVWHMHQPSYRDAETGRVLLPWARLHATKDYADMAALLGRHPRVHATFNLTPILLDQLDAVAAGESDPYLDVARVPAEELTEADRRFLVARFFDVNQSGCCAPHPRYRELRRAGSTEPAGEAAARLPPLTAQEWRDLQVWFHLAWADPSYRDVEPLRSLFAKARGFTEEEKNALLALGGPVRGIGRGHLSGAGGDRTDRGLHVRVPSSHPATACRQRRSARNAPLRSSLPDPRFAGPKTPGSRWSARPAPT